MNKVSHRPHLVLEEHLFKLPRSLYLFVHVKAPEGYAGGASYFVVPTACEQAGQYPQPSQVGSGPCPKGLFKQTDLRIILRPTGCAFYGFLRLHNLVGGLPAVPVLPAATHIASRERLETRDPGLGVIRGEKCEKA